MLDDVVNRLKSLGYDATEDDGFALTFVICKVTNTIKNECNVSEIPDGLRQIAVDMACGEFLSAKKGGGKLTGLEAENIIKSIKEGDTTVTYAVSDGATALDSLMHFLINYGKSQFVTYRRLSW